VKYITWIEKLFGKDSLEGSNCYFQMGIFYYEKEAFKKSLVCFIKTLYIRQKELGEFHPSCGDCHLNMAILYKRMNNYMKAQMAFERALNIRREKVGPSSLEAAAVLENLGKLHLERMNYKESHKCLQECYEIRKKILKYDHKEIEKVSILLLFLSQLVTKQVQETQNHQNATRLNKVSSQIKDIFYN